MHLRVTQLRGTVGALPEVVSLFPMLVCGIGGIVVVALANADAVTLRLRLTTALVAAASAALLDDTASVTLASSPASLAVRRGFRVLIIGVSVGMWWSIATAAAAVGMPHLPVAELGREAVVLTGVATVAALAAQRWSIDGRGGSAGGVAAIGWFALSFLPRIHWVPLPPDPADPRSTGALLVVAVVAACIAMLLSRDPAR